MVRHFEIRKPIWLAFFDGREQYDRQIQPGQGSLSFDGCDVLWTFEGSTRISDTVNWAIGEWLRDGSVEEVGPDREA
jgi:hypothetical protein